MGRGAATSAAGTTAALNPSPQQHCPGLGEGWGLLPLAEGLGKAGKGREGAGSRAGLARALGWPVTLSAKVCSSEVRGALRPANEGSNAPCPAHALHLLVLNATNTLRLLIMLPPCFPFSKLIHGFEHTGKMRGV